MANEAFSGELAAGKLGSGLFLAKCLKIAQCVKKVGSGGKCDWLLEVFYHTY